MTLSQMKKMEKHTPLPYHVGEVRSPAGIPWDCVIRNAKNDPIASVGFSGWDKKTAQANADFIVRACNNYYAFLTALEKIADKDLAHESGILDVDAIVDLQEIANAAIAKAQQEGDIA